MKKTRRVAATLLATGIFVVLPVHSACRVASARAEARSRLYPVKANGRWGYIDRSGAMIVPPQFDEAQQFAEGLGVVKLLGRYGAVRSDGTMAIQPIFSRLLPPAEGLLPYEDSGRWGFLGPSGNRVIEARFEEVRPFREGLAKVKSGGRYGFIDRRGNVVIPPRLSSVDDFSDGRAAFADDGGKRGYIDNTGAVAISPRYSFAEKFSEGLAVVVAGHELSVLRVDGRRAFHIGAFSRSNPAIMMGVFLGDMVFSEGLLPCPRGQRWGYVDATGRERIAARYVSATPFSEGLAAVAVLKTDATKTLVGYIDRGGAWIIEPRFDTAGRFSGGLAPASIGGEVSGCIDRRGDWVWKSSR